MFSGLIVLTGLESLGISRAGDEKIQLKIDLWPVLVHYPHDMKLLIIPLP